MTRIYVGTDEDPAEVITALLALAEDPRSVVWVPEDRALDVPDAVAAEYTKPKSDSETEE